MLVYAKEFGFYFKNVMWRQPTLVLEQLMTEVYASDFVVDAWLEPSFDSYGNNGTTSRSVRNSEHIEALRDIILWSVTLAGICNALKRPLVKLSTVRVYDSVGHGRRRGTPAIGSAKEVGGLYLQAERLVRQRYPATVIYRAPILYGSMLDSPVNRAGRANVGPNYNPSIETNEQLMLAFAGDFVSLAMQQIEAGPTVEPINLWPYANFQPLSWYDASLLAWPEKRELFSRDYGFRKKRSSVFTPDIYGEGNFTDGFRRYREEKANREKEARPLQWDQAKRW